MFLALTLVILPGSAQALMSVGAQGGIEFLDNEQVDVGIPGATFGINRVKFDNPTPIGGVNIAYYFLNAGFLKYDWPAWMGYFAVMVDFTYETFAIRPQDVTFAGVKARWINSTMHGNAPVLAFLLMGHYGFLPDSEVPIGRLHPYLAVGPAIAFTSLNAGSQLAPLVPPSGLPIGSASSVDVALASEIGIRWIALPNVHLDVGFRYRFFQPKYSYNTAIGNVDIKPQEINSFSVIFRVNYVF
jgi:hypothetical protein